MAAQVGEIKWWHTIDLGHGIVTPGLDDSRRKLATLGLPADLSGKTVLDVGAWDGFFAFECERRGAARVVACDEIWNFHDGAERRRGFDLARRALGSRVQDVPFDACTLDPAQIGTFDLVLFLGVLYHLRHPILALERLRAVTRGTLILETETDLRWRRAPALAMYAPRELNADPTNWFAPNEPCLRSMLAAAGFRSVRTVYRTPWWRTIARAGKHLLRHGTPPWKMLQRGRAVVHAS